MARSAPCVVVDNGRAEGYERHVPHGAFLVKRGRMRVAERSMPALLFLASGAVAASCGGDDFCSQGSYECTGGTQPSSGGAGTGGTAGDGLGGSTGTGGSATAGFPSVGGTSGTAGTGEGGAPTGGAAGLSATGGTTGASGESGSSGEGGEGGGAPACDSSKSPSEETCLVSDKAAVFVSPAGSDKNDGTTAKPLKTLARALGVAHDAGKIVLACSTAGAFSEDVTVSASLDGARLYGGFDCETWQYDASKKTEVTSPHTTALRIDALSAGMTIEDVAFTAADAAAAGESSLGAFITASANVRLTRVSITAGKGNDGMSGTAASTPAAMGAAGHNGHDACFATTQPNAGALAVESQCDGTPSGSIGGKGGDGGNDANSAGNGNGGVPDRGGGASGVGEAVPGWACSVGTGQTGNPGISQPSASGAMTLGMLTTTGWDGSAGGSGEDGTPGQGGGGGGGAKAPTACGPLPLTGASGGSGGGGGCGGKGGTGGEAGGSSIALAILDSSVVLKDVVLVATDAGKGGDGGTGQPGGNGGGAGSGGTAATVNNACAGGQGGKGGKGGSGGGAAGGISVGVLWSGSSVPSQTNLSVTTGTPGAKGIGGDAGQNDGITGVSQDELEAP
jgi:hypothetical protein